MWPQKSSIPTPQDRSLEILRGSGGGLKGKVFKEKYKAKLEFPQGWRGLTKIYRAGY